MGRGGFGDGASGAPPPPSQRDRAVSPQLMPAHMVETQPWFGELSQHLCADGGEPDLADQIAWWNSATRCFTADPDATFRKQPKLYRLPTYHWLLMINASLLLLCGCGLEAFATPATFAAVEKLIQSSEGSVGVQLGSDELYRCGGQCGEASCRANRGKHSRSCQSHQADGAEVCLACACIVCHKRRKFLRQPLRGKYCRECRNRFTEGPMGFAAVYSGLLRVRCGRIEARWASRVYCGFDTVYGGRSAFCRGLLRV